jgi:hypothetical protein
MKELYVPGSTSSKPSEPPEVVRYAIAAFSAEGLLPADYVPPKGSWKEQLASVRAKATLGHYRLHPEDGAVEASPEQVARFIAASASAAEGSTDAIAARLLERWTSRSQDYVHRCSRCGQHYDQTVNHQGRQLCLWCLHRVTGQRIPYLLPTTPDPAWDPLDTPELRPHGDAWEGDSVGPVGPQPAEDIPPPPEVS